MFRHLKFLLILFGLLFTSTWLNIAQEQDSSTPTPSVSVFADDTCHAPCWFGLIPGESTTSDVEVMIESTQDIFRVGRGHDNDELDRTDIPVIDGAYRLEWRDFSMRRLQIIPSRIFMENGIIQSIHAKAQHSVSLAEVLEVYGQPDYVQVYASYYCHLYLLYPDNRVVINVSVDLVDGPPLTGIIQNDFNLAEIAYYSPLVAIEAGEVDIGTWHTYLYPSNTPAHRQVSLETWSAWLEDDYIRPCSQTEWDTLTEEIEAPIYPTLTPTPIIAETEVSIFDYDTCAPPCWMGLIPGESTASDVEAMLAENQDLIDPESVTMSVARLGSGEFAIDPDTNEIIRATYTFDVAVPYFDTMGATSRVLISERSVDQIGIHAHERISLETVLNTYGQPNLVRMLTYSETNPSIYLFYSDINLRVSLRADDLLCRLETLNENSVVYNVLYLSTAYLSENFNSLFTDNVKDVPIAQWQSWLAGEVEMSCADARSLLPDPIIIPTLDPIVIPILPNEDCEGACWFGLIPGESTSADVERILMSLEGHIFSWIPTWFNPIIDGETGHVIQGTYNFVWDRTQARFDQNTIIIEDGLVDSIEFIPDRFIPIEEILANPPDDIKFLSIAYREYQLRFVYLNQLLEIRYDIPESCYINALNVDTEMTITYHNYEDASELIETDYGLQPRLLAYSFPAPIERQVSLDTITSWLDKEEDAYCVTLWESLPETIELPEFPAPEATEAPSEE